MRRDTSCHPLHGSGGVGWGEGDELGGEVGGGLGLLLELVGVGEVVGGEEEGGAGAGEVGG